MADALETGGQDVRQEAAHKLLALQALQALATLDLGHSDVSTTMNYTHVLKVAAGGTASPLDALAAVF